MNHDNIKLITLVIFAIGIDIFSSITFPRDDVQNKATHK